MVLRCLGFDHNGQLKAMCLRCQAYMYCGILLYRKNSVRYGCQTETCTCAQVGAKKCLDWEAESDPRLVKHDTQAEVWGAHRNRCYVRTD